MNLYHTLLTDHYRNPRHYGSMANAHFESALHNPSCGDEVRFWARIDHDTIKTISFEGKGCVISMASASLLAEYAHGHSLHELAQCNGNFMQTLIAMPLGPVRLKCALLSLQALQTGIQLFKKGQSHAQSCHLEGKNSGHC
ncbi:MAG TPA: iron-sulfur cluster assembly scaffold protein, partial [Candidatus Bathyarchaeia archaeon]|nr:iron-sulfur cluster assembly scaffold protein [Candidatus Bathyarchaeia archaeon]